MSVFNFYQSKNVAQYPYFYVKCDFPVHFTTMYLANCIITLFPRHQKILLCLWVKKIPKSQSAALTSRCAATRTILSEFQT